LSNDPIPCDTENRRPAVGSSVCRSITPPIAPVPYRLLPEPYVTVTLRRIAVGDIW
jgi:hypothetical protein